MNFEMCTDQNVIAVGEGVVTYVQEAADGGTITVTHFVRKASSEHGQRCDGCPDFIETKSFRYTNVTKIRVAVGDMVMRGAPLGVPKPGRWPHIGLHVVPRGPMNLSGCQTQQGDQQEFVFPVDC